MRIVNLVIISSNPHQRVFAEHFPANAPEQEAGAGIYVDGWILIEPCYRGRWSVRVIRQGRRRFEKQDQPKSGNQQAQTPPGTRSALSRKRCPNYKQTKSSERAKKRCSFQ